MKIISVRENPEIKEEAISYFRQSWPDVLPKIYADSIGFSVEARDSLPQWYLLKIAQETIGCVGLITNDFISRGDLYPWLCALYIEEEHRGKAYGSMLIEKICPLISL